MSFLFLFFFSYATLGQNLIFTIKKSKLTYDGGFGI